MSGSVLFDAPGPKARRLSLTLSIIVGVLILAGLYWLYSVLAAPRPSSGGITLPGMFHPSRWDVFTNPEVWTFIGAGVLRTLQAAGAAAVVAIVLGVVFALLRTAKTAWIRVPTTVVLEFVRGMPVLLMMLFILLAFASGAYWAVVIALGLYNGAIIGEALRAGLAALPRGQREAGLSLGMRELQTRMLIEFPQAFRQMLPIIVAQLVVLLKDTSLGFIVGYPELLRSTMNNLASFYGNRYLFSFFAVTLVIYLIMNLTLSFIARWLSKRTDSARRGGKAGKDIPVDPALAIAQASAAARQAGQGSI
ncbi:glutamate transport system permease protein [Okibacterium sp. HSC-33S16]|uniref:amino acid ABC transporter permease n=1 Tax=Okibacterium sp. HSC-33S16 TaxID=2910965 RepID=UPI00209F823B|nr:amino acid ABC transporter permease [Okibacterium sp. HSC-33S16]MCP2031966.1 glutamate transport system permease protein [Okibacterium sp. HSC-33S16]